MVRYRIPVALLLAFACLMLMQLIPLPPSLWMHFPGRAIFASAAQIAQTEQPWRPLSLVPDRTLNSFFALIPPVTVLLAGAAMRRDQRLALIPITLLVVVASAVLGILQSAGGDVSPFYLFHIHSQDVPVGFFSNRNHQATLLALALPLLVVFLSMSSRNVHAERSRAAMALVAALLILPSILATGSRTGMVMGAVMLLLAAVLFFTSREPRPMGPQCLPAWVGWGALLALLTIAAATLYFGRAVSVDRIMAFDADAEQRLRSLPVVLDMIRHYFPAGTGYGAFDAAYRIAEPDALLHPTYFNHAHNDLLELILEGGIIAAILLVAFLMWWIVTTIKVARGPYPFGARALAGLAGSAGIGVLLASSLVDYPLRTTLLAVVLATCCLWLGDAAAEQGWAGRQKRQRK